MIFYWTTIPQTTIWT